MSAPRSESRPTAGDGLDRYLARARERLLQTRQGLVERLGGVREAEGALLGERESDPVDFASNEGTAIPLDSLGVSEEGQIREIDAALGRIDRVEYGLCETCDEQIEVRRLEAVPWARRCFEDEVAYEKEHRGAPVV